MSKITQQDFINFFKYYKDEPHQLSAIRQLYSELSDELKSDTADWIVTYRTPLKPITANPLDVPFQSQNDNISGTGYRECFSSSCAMVAMYYGKIENDDAYNLVRQKYGDSTDAQAQVRALRSLGLEANFVTNARTEDLKASIDANRPIPCGWLHKGSVNCPSGNGHYSVVIGYNDSGWIQNDPNGEALLVPGGYTNNLNGDHVHYSYKNWNPRWIVEGEGSGWMMDIRDPAKK
tara:strand:+ start:1482 stop:2183 length:702 start_codon:yes stop_codon:yes gene_type:complete